MQLLLLLLGLLKIIGIILLVLLAILLFLLGCILFIPIHYKLEGEKEKKLLAQGTLWWLFHAIRADFIYQEGEETRICLKFLWFYLFDSQKKEPSSKTETQPVPIKKPLPSKEDKKTPIHNVADTKKAAEKDTIQKEPLQQPKEEKPLQKEVPSSSSAPQNASNEKPKVRRIPKKEILETFTEQNQEKQEKEKEKEETLNLDYFLKMPLKEKKRLTKAVYLLLKRILKQLLPRKIDVKAYIGTQDPATTGYLLAACGMSQLLLGNHLQVKGDFEKPVLEGTVLIKGKITLVILGHAAICFLLKKQVRHIIKLYWKG